MHLDSDHNDGVTVPARLVERIDATEREITSWMKSSEHKVSHLVMSGISGQSVGWPLSARLQLPGLVVRKPREDAHSGLIVGHGDVKDYILVDDFISTGSTINRVVSAMTIKHFNSYVPGYVLDPADHLLKTAPICRAIFTYRMGFSQYDDATNTSSNIFTPDLLEEGLALPVIPKNFTHPGIPVFTPVHDGFHYQY